MTVSALEVPIEKRLGWKADLPDARDHRRRAPSSIVSLPSHVDLRPLMPPVYDQMSIGSCTANAIAAAIEYDRKMKKFSPLWTPSRLQIYFNERAIENSIEQDSGAMIRDGIKACAKNGVCDEALWPYDISKFKNEPSEAATTEALKHLVTSYARIVQTTDEIRACLNNGFPIVFGFSVYSSFDSDAVTKTGIMSMPDLDVEQVIGGHAVLCVGYDDPSQMFIVRNSWGNWGDAGYFYMPYAFMRSSDFCDDLWHIDGVSS